MANPNEEGIYYYKITKGKNTHVVGYRLSPFGVVRPFSNYWFDWSGRCKEKIAPVKLLKWNNDNTGGGS